MITIFCRLLEERREVLNILHSMGAVWNRQGTLLHGKKVQPCDITNVAPHGRIYYVINDSNNPIEVRRVDLSPRGPIMNAADFIKVHTSKNEKLVADFSEPLYPFDLIGDPIELEKGSNMWYRQINPDTENVILQKPVLARWRSSTNMFNIAAIIKGREKPFVGTPNGSTPGPLFVRVAAPKNVVKMTKKELEALVAEKLGKNIILEFMD